MKFHRDIKNNKLDKLIIADHIVLGFNTYFLIEVLYETINAPYDEDEMYEFVDMMNVHYQQGILTQKITLNDMMNHKLRNDIIAECLLDFYDLYKVCMYYLLEQYKIDALGITHFFKQMFYTPPTEVEFIDYMQAHRWFVTVIDCHAGRRSKKECYKHLYRVDPQSNFVELLTMGEVEKLADNICQDFIDIVEKRKSRCDESSEQEKSEVNDMVYIKNETHG